MKVRALSHNARVAYINTGIAGYPVNPPRGTLESLYSARECNARETEMSREAFTPGGGARGLRGVRRGMQAHLSLQRGASIEARTGAVFSIREKA